MSILLKSLFINKSIKLQFPSIRSTFRSFRTNQLFNMKIGTHDDVFHCDEVLACFMLKQLPEFKDAEIVRTRDLNKLKDCDIVVDVGAQFDHAVKRYDHHQKEFKETLSSLRPELGDKYKIKLSSAGLIYTYYGERVIEEVLKPAQIPSSDLKIVYKKVYESFIEEIDAIDNGVPMTDSEPLYRIHSDLSSRINRLNPEWNTQRKISIDEVFVEAMKVVSEEFLYNVMNYVKVWLPAREFVKQAIEERFNIHNSGEIIVFNERFPWKGHLFDLEMEMELEGVFKYALFMAKPNSWRICAVPIAPSSFVLRKPLNKKWWGIRDDILSQTAGIEGCVFCHSTGFIAGNLTKEGALQMAIASLEAN